MIVAIMALGSIDKIKKLITNAASKYPHDDPIHLILLCLVKFLMLVSDQLTSFSERLTLLDCEVEALHSKLEMRFLVKGVTQWKES